MIVNKSYEMFQTLNICNYLIINNSKCGAKARIRYEKIGSISHQSIVQKNVATTR